MSLVPPRRLALYLALVSVVLVFAGVLLSRSAPDRAGITWAILTAILVAAAAFSVAVFQRSDPRLTALRMGAEALVRGELGARVPVDAHDDVASLGRALNAAAAALEEKFIALESERRSSGSVIANLKQGVALLSVDLVIRMSNDRFWSIVGLDRPAGSPRLTAARQPVLEEVAEAALHSGRATSREVSLYVGERTEYEVTGSPIRGSGGAAGVLLTIEDLRPERVMANLRREFVANVSHELKTPLTSIRGYAETLLSGGLQDEANRDRFVETIRNQAERLEALVNDLLKLAELERPDATLDLKDWDLSAVVREVASTFEELALRRGLRIAVDAPPGIFARLDRGRIELVLANLLDNAVKYTDRGGVELRVERHGGMVRVSATDTGRGIAQEHLPRVFERFYRADLGRSREGGGTGLGLSIVKHAVLLHGGTLGVESRIGEGSTFWFEIPVHEPGTP